MTRVTTANGEISIGPAFGKIVRMTAAAAVVRARPRRAAGEPEQRFARISGRYASCRNFAGEDEMVGEEQSLDAVSERARRLATIWQAGLDERRARWERAEAERLRASLAQLAAERRRAQEAFAVEWGQTAPDLRQIERQQAALRARLTTLLGGEAA